MLRADTICDDIAAFLTERYSANGNKNIRFISTPENCDYHVIRLVRMDTEYKLDVTDEGIMRFLDTIKVPKTKHLNPEYSLFIPDRYYNEKWYLRFLINDIYQSEVFITDFETTYPRLLFKNILSILNQVNRGYDVYKILGSICSQMLEEDERKNRRILCDMLKQRSICSRLAREEIVTFDYLVKRMKIKVPRRIYSDIEQMFNTRIETLRTIVDFIKSIQAASLEHDNMDFARLLEERNRSIANDIRLLKLEVSNDDSNRDRTFSDGLVYIVKTLKIYWRHLNIEQPEAREEFAKDFFRQGDRFNLMMLAPQFYTDLANLSDNDEALEPFIKEYVSDMENIAESSTRSELTRIKQLLTSIGEHFLINASKNELISFGLHVIEHIQNQVLETEQQNKRQTWLIML